MQLDRDTAKQYGVNPLNPRENILAGAAVLASLLQRYDGDLRRVLRKYNASWTLAYDAKSSGLISRQSNLTWLPLPPQNSQIRLTILFRSQGRI